MREMRMWKSVVLYALGFAAIAVAYGLIKTALKGDALAVDPELIVVMALVGGLGQVFAWHRSKR